MNLLEEAGLYARFAIGLRRFLRQNISVVQAREIVARRLEERKANLLRTLRVCVFAHRHSPYLPLFRRAGCELGDVEAMLADRGVEATLEALYDAGVRVSFDEFKGRRPIVRGGLELAVRASDFDNPRRGASFRGESSGTSGTPARSYHDLAHILETVPFRLLAAAAFGVERAPFGMWLTAPPGVAGMNSALAAAVSGNPPERWWTPAGDGAAVPRPALRQRWALRSFLALCSGYGVRLPAPQALSFDEPGPIVDWAADALRRSGRCEIRGFASTAMRVALAASVRGADLSGAVFFCGGEAATPAKQAIIECCGGRMVSLYAITECGPLGMSCAQARDARDLHVCSDRLAVISRSVQLSGWTLAVESLHLTSLLPATPKVILNVETDDCGTLEEGSCDCLLGAAGYRTHLRDVRSHRRLTGRSVTLIRESDARLIEETLPARFGGSPLDYQLHEEERGAGGGAPGLSLLVSPELNLPAVDQVIRVVLDGLAAGSRRNGDTLRVRRERPMVSKGGKHLPLVTGGDGGSALSAS